MVRLGFGAIVMTGVLSALAGGGGLGSVTAPNANPNDTQFNATATANFALLNTGAYTSTNEAGGNWLTGATASQFDAMLTLVSGTGPTGAAMATWLNLGTNRTWTRAVFGNNALDTTVCTLQIRETASGIVRGTSTITFSVESDTI